MRLLGTGLGLVGLLLTSLVLGDSPRQDPDREEALALVRRSLAENCLMCHSEEMIHRQRLTPKQWGAEVEKMVNWGSPLPKEQAPALVAYLSETYPATAAPAARQTIKAEDALAIDRAVLKTKIVPAAKDALDRGAAVFKTHCANCHGPDARGGDLGTNLVEKPILLREDHYHAIIRNGLRRMPGFKTILKPEQEAELLAWLRSRK